MSELKPRLMSVDNTGGRATSQFQAKIDSILASNEVLESEPSRFGAYATVIRGLGYEVLSHSARVMEVGMNNKLFLFRDVFPKDVQFFVVTREPFDYERAKSAAQRVGAQANIKLKDVDEGLPEGFDEMDLILDIFSASHYAKTNPIPKYVDALKPGGYVGVVSGRSGFMDDMANYVRNYPFEERGFVPADVVFRYKKGGKFDIPINPENVDRNRRPIIDALKDVYPQLSKKSTMEEVTANLEDMVNRLGFDSISNYDLDRMMLIRSYERMGLTGVRLLNTKNDGVAVLAQKPS